MENHKFARIIDPLSYIETVVGASLPANERIPSDFVRKNRVILSVKQVKLRTSNGETWNVKLQKMDNGEYYFTKGWNKFAENFGVKIMEFIVFKYAEDSIFDVTMYRITDLENEISGGSESDSDEDNNEDEGMDEDYDPMNNQGGEEDHVELEEESGSGSREQSALYFERLPGPSHEKRVILGKRFAMAANLIDKETVRLEYVPTQYYEDVRLYRRETQERLRIELAKGWISFRNTNLLCGRTYSFEFNPNKNTIEVKELF